MARLTVQKFPTAFGAVNITDNLVACDAGGDEFIFNTTANIIVENGDVASKTVTIATPRKQEGLDISDPSYTIPAGKTIIIPTLDGSLFKDSAGLVQITYDAVTSLTILVVEE